jgi:O-antigen polysaccharide polymerase Wzy
MSSALGDILGRSRVRPAALLVTALVCAVLAWVVPSAAFSLVLAGLVAAGSMAAGIRRSWIRTCAVDPFAPHCFPLLYVALSSLYPAWLILHDRVALMGFSLDGYGSRTAGLVALSVIGLAIGIHLPATPEPHSSQPESEDAKDSETSPEERTSVASLLRLAGRSLAVLLVIVGVVVAVLVGPQNRALNQSTYQLSDSVQAMAMILALPAVLLILVAREHLTRSRSDSVVDWSLIGALVVGSSLTGGRAIAITAMLCVAFYGTRRAQNVGRMLAPFAAIAVFAFAVLAYRQWAMQDQETHDPVRSAATDLSPVSYTLGLVSGKVPSEVGYKFGGTYGDALVHQLPSIITVPIMGPADHTGSMVFRNQILHMTDADSGYGFSVPADAYLNFGSPGVLVLGVGLGWLLGWAYSRQSWPSLRTRSFIYICLVAPLPFAYRSDALGAIKGSLYPVLLMALSLWAARRIVRSPHLGWLARIAGWRLDVSPQDRAALHEDVQQRALERDHRDGGR